MHPQYIKLTAVRATIPPQRQGQPAQMTMFQPPVERLLPLPQAFTKNQQDGRTEVEGPGMVITYRERFDDVVAAIGQAAQLGNAIALVVDRDAIAEATNAAMEQAAIGGRGAVRITLEEAITQSMGNINAALESEGYVKNGAAVDENDPKWKDFVQTDGESVGAPAYSREPKGGDLRIHSVEVGRYFLEQAFRGDARFKNDPGEIVWRAPDLPFHLLRTFDSRDELIEAVEKAGRGKLLVNA